MSDSETVSVVAAWLLGCGIGAAAAMVLPAAQLKRFGWFGSTWRIFALALGVRLVAALVFRLPESAVINFDKDSLEIVGQLVRDRVDVYSRPERYPYFPFFAYWFGATSWFSSTTGLPFEPLPKLAGIAADAGIAVLLLKWWRPIGERGLRLGLFYALNPLTILVSSVHGQIDSGAVFFLLAAAYTIRGDVTPRSGLVTGALLGLAVVSKTWPIAFLPLFVLRLPTWRARTEVTVLTFGVVGLSLLVYSTIFGVDPRHAIDTIREYEGVRGQWGMFVALYHLGNAGVPGAIRLHDLGAEWDKYLLVAALGVGTALAWRADIARGIGIALLATMVVFYGWGYHWMMWAVPFLLLGFPLRVAAAYYWVAAATLVAVFFFYGGITFWAFELFDVESAMIRYRWAMPLPLWTVVCAIVAGVLLVRIRSTLRARADEVPEAEQVPA